jgi:hypothetical protein
LEATPQPSVAEEDIRSLTGYFTPSGIEKDGVIARSGWERLNEITGEFYWEYYPRFKTYVQENLTQAIETIEGVLFVNVSLGIPGYDTTENGTGTTYIRFQLAQDVYDDSKRNNHITDWGRTIRQNLTDLLKTEWYVTQDSVRLEYEIPYGPDPADAGFTLGVTLAAFVFLLLLIKKGKRRIDFQKTRGKSKENR